MSTAATPSSMPPPIPTFVTPVAARSAPVQVRAAITRAWFSFGVCATVLGTFWLLSSLRYLPDINWVWVLALAATGFVPVIAAGLNKFSFAFCGFMLACSTASMLRQMGLVTLNVTVPSLVISAGVLALVSLVLPIRLPKWMEAGEQVSR
ncbi:MAG TPA: hypothetical protein VHN77_13495 [Phycisphaerales bacterium]|nr:hypothetical protein [Phycisphaerales bacterium]